MQEIAGVVSAETAINMVHRPAQSSASQGVSQRYRTAHVAAAAMANRSFLGIGLGPPWVGVGVMLADTWEGPGRWSGETPMQVSISWDFRSLYWSVDCIWAFLGCWIFCLRNSHMHEIGGMAALEETVGAEASGMAGLGMGIVTDSLSLVSLFYMIRWFVLDVDGIPSNFTLFSFCFIFHDIPPVFVVES